MRAGLGEAFFGVETFGASVLLPDVENHCLCGSTSAPGERLPHEVGSDALARVLGMNSNPLEVGDVPLRSNDGVPDDFGIAGKEDHGSGCRCHGLLETVYAHSPETLEGGVVDFHDCVPVWLLGFGYFCLGSVTDRTDRAFHHLEPKGLSETALLPDPGRRWIQSRRVDLTSTQLSQALRGGGKKVLPAAVKPEKCIGGVIVPRSRASSGPSA